MEIITVEQRLQSEGLDYPQLNALQADDTLYTLLAHQPPGRIRITSTSIGNADPVEAHQRSSALFDLVASLDNQPDLLVSPEYSIPWEALQDAIERGIKPGRGKLWVLGCESIPLNGLNSVRERLDQLAVVLDDDSFPGALTTQQYRDPLVYAFLSNASVDKAERLVLLVQYKTAPSGDPENTEATGMLPGVYVYAFGSQPSEVRLITLICSDVFEFTQE